MRHTERVLVVTDDPETSDQWSATVALAGYDVRVCPGPGATRDCPRLHGVRCTLRESAQVAVVDLDCDEEATVCVRIPEDGGSVFARRSAAPGAPALLFAVDDARRYVGDLLGSPATVAVPVPDLD